MEYQVKKNSDGKFGVYKKNAKRASRVFDSKEKAEQYASKMNMASSSYESAQSNAKQVGSIYQKVVPKHKGKRKKKSAIVTCCTILFFLISLGVTYYCSHGFKDFVSSSFQVKPVIDGDLQFHFLELGNKYTGDSIYIKAGDMDILIDAGSREDSATAIGDYIDQYCTDGVLEYVIATHAHQDHIAGFVGDATHKGILSRYKVETLIDFGKTDSNSKIYQNYANLRSALQQKGTNYYTQLDCYYEQNGGQRIIKLSDNITMEILYNRFAERGGASGENNYSVCTLFKQKSNYYLMTGDLEKDGEENLIADNDLPQVVLYKAGHHGSYTSSSTEFMKVIQPKIVTVCCCAGTDEYTTNKNHQFPSQEFITRTGIYTDKIYVTSLGTETGYTSFNGNIIVSSYGQNVNVQCSVSNTILKESEWFKNNRVWPVNGV